MELAVWMQHLPTQQHLLFTGRWNRQNKQHHIFSGLSGVCICYQLSACFDVPREQIWLRAQRKCWQVGHRKAYFFPPTSITHGFVKKKERKESFHSQTHFHLASCFLSDGGKWVNVIPFLMVEQANLLTPPAIVDWLSDGRGGRW